MGDATVLFLLRGRSDDVFDLGLCHATFNTGHACTAGRSQPKGTIEDDPCFHGSLFECRKGAERTLLAHAQPLDAYTRRSSYAFVVDGDKLVPIGPPPVPDLDFGKEQRPVRIS